MPRVFFPFIDSALLRVPRSLITSVISNNFSQLFSPCTGFIKRKFYIDVSPVLYVEVPGSACRLLECQLNGRNGQSPVAGMARRDSAAWTLV